MIEVVELLQLYFKRISDGPQKSSLRTIAKSIPVSPAYLSQILSGKRPLPLKIVRPLCTALDIDQETEYKIIFLILKNQNEGLKTSDYYLQKVESDDVGDGGHNWVTAGYKDMVALKSWDYFAIMQSTLLPSYDGTVKFITELLGLSSVRVEQCLRELSQSGLMSINPETGYLEKSSQFVEYQSRDKVGLREYHTSCLEKAVSVMTNEVSDADVERRLITGLCFTCSSDEVPALKQKIASFLKKMAKSDSVEHDTVYQLSVAFIPVSKKS